MGAGRQGALHTLGRKLLLLTPKAVARVAIRQAAWCEAKRAVDAEARDDGVERRVDGARNVEAIRLVAGGPHRLGPFGDVRAAQLALRG